MKVAERFLGHLRDHRSHAAQLRWPNASLVPASARNLPPASRTLRDHDDAVAVFFDRWIYFGEISRVNTISGNK
jgi:hypothetical protein